MKKNDIRKFTSKKPVVIEVKEITTREKMEIIKDYYRWLCSKRLDANQMYCYMWYEKYLKTK